MGKSATEYDGELLRERIDKFFDKSPKGGDYHDLKDYLENSGIHVGEKPTLVIGSFLSGLSQGPSLEKIPISKEVYVEFYGKEPRVEPLRRLFNIYISSKYHSAIEEIKTLKEKWQMREDVKIGLTPFLKGRILDNRLFDLLQDLAHEDEYLDIVLAERLKETEENARRIGIEAQQKIDVVREEAYNTIENIVVTAIKELNSLYIPLKAEVVQHRKKVDNIRKELREAEEEARKPQIN